MKKVIQIINYGTEPYYHVSHNPNNGNLTFTKDIRKASVFESDWDMTFIPTIKNHIIRQYPMVKINIVDMPR